LSANRENIRLELVKLCHKPTQASHEDALGWAREYEKYVFGDTLDVEAPRRRGWPKSGSGDQQALSDDTEESLGE